MRNAQLTLARVSDYHPHLDRLSSTCCSTRTDSTLAESRKKPTQVTYHNIIVMHWIFTTYSPKGRDDQQKSDLQSFIVEYQLIVSYAGTYLP
jgi:hypothetical protein